MIKRIFGSKLLALFLSMAAVGFFIGYNYAAVDAKKGSAETVKAANKAESSMVIQQNETTQEDAADTTGADEIEETEEEPGAEIEEIG